MEGPSLYLAAKWLAPFVGKTISAVEGNTRIGKERLEGKIILDIFSWGKHLIFQFEDFALRIHFMLFGSFEAILKNKKITGDYPKKKANPRLALIFKEGQIFIYSSSLKYIETSYARNLYDFSTDIMSYAWDPKKALDAIKLRKEDQIGDVLLDQSIFSGVGNIIKNEVLFLVKRKPTTLIKNLSQRFLLEIIKTAKEFSLQFYKWRKKFILKKHYKIYRKSFCLLCGEKIIRIKTGKNQRISFYCPKCQK